MSEWRVAHERFWTQVVDPELGDLSSLHLDNDTQVVVERFRVIA